MKTLHRRFLECYNPNKRSNTDRRKKVAWAVFSYYDERGDEYRRSFEQPQNTPEQTFWTVAPETITI